MQSEASSPIVIVEGSTSPSDLDQSEERDHVQQCGCGFVSADPVASYACLLLILLQGCSELTAILKEADVRGDQSCVDRDTEGPIHSAWSI